MVARGLRASVSICSSITPPVGEADARSKAAANSSVCLTVSAMDAIGPGKHGKIWIDDIGPRNTFGIGSFLVHANGAIGGVIENDEDGIEVGLAWPRQARYHSSGNHRHRRCTASTKRSGSYALAASAAVTPNPMLPLWGQAGARFGRI